MNGKERMKLAMRGEKPDRVPLMCQLATGHIYGNAGVGPLEYWYTPKGYVEGNVRMTDRYRFDGILSDVGEIRDPEEMAGFKSFEKVSGGHLACLENGSELYFPEAENPFFIRLEGVSRHPDKEAVIRYFNDEGDIPDHHKEVLGEIQKRKGAELSVHGEVGTAFEKLLYQTDTLDDGLMALLDEPERCRRILEKYNKSVILFALYQCGAGIDALKLSSPFAGAGFISRNMYKEFVLPFEREVVSAVKEKYDIPCYIHTCGKIGDRLDLIVQTGIDGIECLDPIPLGDVDLERAVGEIGDRVFIKGNLDSVNELMNKSRNEIVETVHKRIETGKKAGKGFILSTACSVSPRVPPENMELLIETVEKYGNY